MLVVHAAGAQTRPGVKQLAILPDASVSETVLSPNAKFILYAASGPSDMLRVFDRASGKAKTLLPIDAWDLAWTPKGDGIAFVRFDDRQNNVVWSMPMDPKTGAPRGAAQRVSVEPGDSPSVSPDGKWIAYAADDTADAQRLAIVPFTGGPERTIARMAGGVAHILWSPDGVTLFFRVGFGPGKPHVLYKTRVDGGSPRKLQTGFWDPIGISPDGGRIALSPVDILPPLKVLVIDTAGNSVSEHEVKTLELKFRGNITTAGWSGGMPVIVALEEHVQLALEIVPADGGTARTLPSISTAMFSPQWSRDGKQIAFKVITDSGYKFGVMRADGSNARALQTADGPAQPIPGWSQDGKYFANGFGFHGVTVLDVTTGKTQSIVVPGNAPTATMRWKADGHTLLLAVFHFVPGANPPGAEIWEGVPGATPRKLRTIDVPHPWSGLAFVDDSTVVAAMDSGLFALPVKGGGGRRLKSQPGIIERLAVSPDHQWLAALLVAPKQQQFREIELISMTGNDSRVVDLPFHGLSGGQAPVFAADGQSVFVLGSKENSGTVMIFRVPLNGEPPKAIATIGKPPLGFSEALVPQGFMSLSPDGRSLLYARETGSPTNVVVEVAPAAPVKHK
jgi:Tol biopolymer transport system component